MRRDITQWARQCTACATSKVAVHVKPAMQPIPVAAERFSHVHIDIVGPFPAEQGKKYLLTMIDRTTRWPEVVPLAETTVDAIYRLS